MVPQTRSASRVFAVALSLFVLISGTADIVRLFHPIGVFGTIATADFVVTSVAPGLPADRAGIRPGDRFDIHALPAQYRWFLFPVNCTSPGVTMTIGVIRGGHERRVTMTSVPEPMGVSEQTAILVNIVAGLLFVLLGTVTVLLRPTAIVWGFYLYCLGSAPFPYRYFDATLRLPMSAIWLSAIVVIGAAALPGLLIFSVSVLQDSVSGWRLALRRASWISFFALAGLALISLVRNYFLGIPAQQFEMIYRDIGDVLAITIAAALIATYIRAAGADRQRLLWVVIGIGIALGSPYIDLLLSNLSASSPALYDCISVIRAAAPVGVAYAILKHRVINVSFFVSRTIVYGTITAILVAAFAFVDWLVGKVLDQSRLATVAEVLAAICIGVWMNALHGQVDRFVDNVLFRSRHLAEKSLARLALGLPYAASYRVVDEMLAEEPLECLGLTSAALFRRTAPNRFERMAAVGWSPDAVLRLDEHDRLVVHLEGERQALRLSEVRWKSSGLPQDNAEPALALPVFVRHQLNAILVLGPHATGEDFDADEIRLLENCAIAAGAAYDHLEADALRDRVQDLQRTIESMSTTLQSNGLMGPTRSTTG